MLVTINSEASPLPDKRNRVDLAPDSTGGSVLSATEALCKRIMAERGINSIRINSKVISILEQQTTSQVHRLAEGAWRRYIIARSGKPFQLAFIS
ncbi:MAG: hypothetical protein GYA24_20170 [Candidatus Lokiarchaeota archaeon]|nr:hypothetical protein [Candidatus Lokiarchaeota archaeon]